MFTQAVSTLAYPLPTVKQIANTQEVVRRSLRQSAAETPLAQWLVEYGEGRGWETGRQAAKYLGVKQAAFSTWLRGEVEPGRDYQEQLAAKTGQPVAFFANLVRLTKAWKLQNAAGDAAVHPEPAGATAGSGGPVVAIGEAPPPGPLVVSAAQLEEIVTRAIAHATDAVTERVVERLHEVLGVDQPEEVATVLQRAGIGDPATLDDRIPVMFSGVIWEELTEEEKRGVISLVKRLMGRPHGRMGKRGSR